MLAVLGNGLEKGVAHDVPKESQIAAQMTAAAAAATAAEAMTDAVMWDRGMAALQRK